MGPGPASSVSERPSPRLATALLTWFRAHRRPLPWRGPKDPYRIWVAEVLLQQTRVARAVPYFERFLRRFPTVRALAEASPSVVLKAWEGAGYYARARNLHAAARLLVRTNHGRVPRTVEALERMPGVGRYTARAVASLAFGVPVVALEANGLRVAARWTREEGDPREARVRERLESALAAALPRAAAGTFNEAVMELGETVCLPGGPALRRVPGGVRLSRVPRARRPREPSETRTESPEAARSGRRGGPGAPWSVAGPTAAAERPARGPMGVPGRQDRAGGGAKGRCTTGAPRGDPGQCGPAFARGSRPSRVQPFHGRTPRVSRDRRIPTSHDRTDPSMGHARTVRTPARAPRDREDRPASQGWG